MSVTRATCGQQRRRRCAVRAARGASGPRGAVSGSTVVAIS